jgi:DNA (cytosine-5)-methyltransferase 1
MLRAIREIQPTWVVGENVFGLINWDGGLVFDEVQADLEAAGYEVWPYVLPACAVNAPHRRDRVWFVAYCDKSRLQKARAEQQAAGVIKHGKLGSITPDSSSIGRDNRGDNRQERHIPRNEWTTEKSQSERNGRKCGIGTSSKITPNSHRNGLDERNGNNEINTGQRGEYAQRDVEQMGGDAADSNGTRREKQHVATKSIRQDVNSRDAMYANSTSKPGQCFRQEREGKLDRPNSGNGIDAWQNFPTQPPICGGNDGLPGELDGITFSKWRNESIKAYGNAIVPQVAFQIFKAIEELSHNRTT